MYSAQDILCDREKRDAVIKKAALAGDVVTVKANVPGADKNIPEGNLLVRYFVNRALESFGGTTEFYGGADGFCGIISAPAGDLKERAVELETSRPIGRYIDIDVFFKGGDKSASRGHMRKCFLCGEPAFVCARLKTHTVEELLNALKTGVRDFFSARICDIIKSSLMAELDLKDKFGLVTPDSNGSHSDLNYALMQRAQDAIIPYLVQCFWTGLGGGEENPLAELRRIGIEAEREMYKAAGANAYKGFIFAGGILLAAAGLSLSGGKTDIKEIFSNVKKICRGICGELEQNCGTFGGEAYAKYKITGARGHAERGFYAVENAVYRLGGDLSPISLKKALCKITGETEDTVLLKRCRSFEKYLYFKNKISSVDPADEEAVKALTRECVENNVSIGGSADVLAAAVLITEIYKLFYFSGISVKPD